VDAPVDYEAEMVMSPSVSSSGLLLASDTAAVQKKIARSADLPGSSSTSPPSSSAAVTTFGDTSAPDSLGGDQGVPLDIFGISAHFKSSSSRNQAVFKDSNVDVASSRGVSSVTAEAADIGSGHSLVNGRPSGSGLVPNSPRIKAVSHSPQDDRQVAFCSSVHFFVLCAQHSGPKQT